ADDIVGPGLVVNGSHNLVVAASGVTLPADTIADDPLLLPLADNGGMTMTHALAKGSPALDAGSNSLALAFDQRGDGYARVSGSASDIGAFESQPDGADDRIFADGFDPAP
ncbi:MAG TPA: choice-of-anchor Q domain-containing protein, partial [Dokdonella sp.]